MNRDGQLRAFLKKQVPTLDDPDFPMSVHEKSYLDLFPKEKLVYLTPHCREEMQEYDHDAIYIIGAIVDKVSVIFVFNSFIFCYFVKVYH